jgi:gamma-glutamyl-gamma-aminobutyrate hydrolase PuuD
MKRIALPVKLDEQVYKMNSAYVDYLYTAGFSPHLIPRPLLECQFEERCSAAAGECDGLLLPGGADIDPVYYGEDNLTCLGTDVTDDSFERYLFQAFLTQSKPVFGICRGFQLLAREFLHRSGITAPQSPAGGRLYFRQHLEGHHDPSRLSVPRSRLTKYVEINPHLLYADAESPPERHAVNSIHHQALVIEDRCLSPRTVLIHPEDALSAWKIESEPQLDRLVVEGLDFSAFFKAPVAGVQWHPEEIGDTGLLHVFR